MPNTFFISDTHFGHEGMVKFLRSDRTKCRPWDTIEAHDEALIENWNKVVRPQDRVYHLGDVVINRRCLPMVERCNGKKVLIKGNHDIFKLADYAKYFEDIRAYKVIVDEFIASHIPIHVDSLSERFKFNVHGHTHHNLVMFDNAEADVHYINVCCEHTNYTPISLDEIRHIIKERT